MNEMTKKLVLSFGGAFLMVATSLTAADTTYNSNASKASSCETDCCDPCCGQWSAQVEWLYWRPCADSVYAALTGELTSECTDCSTNIAVGTARVKNFDFELSSGFRLGLGYSNPSCNCWDVALVWTHFSPEEDEKVTSRSPAGSSSTFLFPFFSQNFLFENSSEFKTLDSNEFISINSSMFQEVKAEWDLSLNLLDLDFSFAYCLNQCFEFHPFFGLRYVYLDQSLKSKSFFDTGTNRVDTLRQKYSNVFNAVGPHGGFGATWDLGCGFGLYGDLGLTLAFGQKEAKGRIEFEQRTNGVLASIPGPWKQKGSDKGNCSRPITDLGFGATYAYRAADCVDTVVRIGWEHHYFFNQGVADGTAGTLQLAKQVNSDLSTQGLTFGLRLAY